MSGAQHIIDAVFEPFDQQTLVDAFVADEQSDVDFREGPFFRFFRVSEAHGYMRIQRRR